MGSLRAHVSAQCVERIRVTDRWEARLDEDGAAAGKQANRAVRRVARSFGAQFNLYGTVVIVGLDKGTDAPALSPAQAGAILRKIVGAP
jgi:hypothetical protein